MKPYITVYLPEEVHSRVQTLEKIYTRQVSTTLTEEQYQQWRQLCKHDEKSSFLLLRDVILAVLGNPTEQKDSSTSL